jgi:hypothetical protein
MANDFKGRRPTDSWQGHDLPSSVSIAESGGAQIASLNPAWVEALMGFPAGWTDPGPQGAESRNTRGSLRARRRREEPQE